MNKLKTGTASRAHRSAVSGANWQEWISETAALPGTASAAAPRDDDRQRHQEAIARQAYANWEARGCPHGSAEEDWLLAERQLLHPTTTNRVTDQN
ncbi:MAG: DUF2934 domain-containing protein [Acidobacteriia bacterium]|nr:DUF2934 domain-containing protein [Terriglobia bacterium]